MPTRSRSPVKPAMRCAPVQDAYGQLCTIVPLMVNTLQDLVLEAIDTAAGSLHDTADRLDTAAAGYHETDEATTDDLRRLEGGR